MKLFFLPGACSLSPHIALREAGVAFDLVRVNRSDKKTAEGEDFFAINPLGLVPVLRLDDGTVLTEGPAIVQYIADLNPGAHLAPANGTIARYKLQETLNFLTAEIHKNYAPLFNPKAPDEYKTIARDSLATRYRILDERLAKSAYLMGDTFTVADGYLFTMLGWAPHAGVNLSGFPALNAYRARIAERPAVIAAMTAEGLIKKPA
jgi:glutathione S-transferase